jgi:release factor glutamine methyltransferase
MTLREALAEASLQITRRDAETLLAHVLHRDRAWLLAHADDRITPSDHDALRALTARRAASVPLQHLTGTQEFFGLRLRVTPDVLIPRPETEHLVEAVLDWLKGWHYRHIPRILDVGTGTGAIALALAKHIKHVRVTASDISLPALDIARENARRLGLDRSDPGWEDFPKIKFVQSDLLSAFSLPSDPFTGRMLPIFDVIVSNPPYVAEADAPTLAPEVRDHEPHLALFAGADGLTIYRRLIPQAHAALQPGGLLAMEIGFGQRDALAELLAHPIQAWQNVRFVDDYAGIPRIVLANRS